ncbi:hypothetical protein GMMP15_580027 [Candidatus Magnetomoraceae bacterium gMMP-15]
MFRFQNVGFHILRSTSEDGKYTRITVSLIPSKGTISGASYAYIDITHCHSCYYKLEFIDYNNIRTFYTLSAKNRKISSGLNQKNLDINKDGAFNIGDVIYLLQYLKN